MVAVAGLLAAVVGWAAGAGVSLAAGAGASLAAAVLSLLAAVVGLAAAVDLAKPRGLRWAGRRF